MDLYDTSSKVDGPLVHFTRLIKTRKSKTQNVKSYVCERFSPHSSCEASSSNLSSDFIFYILSHPYVGQKKTLANGVASLLDTPLGHPQGLAILLAHWAAI
jgi:hypothetical protein